MRWLIDQQEPDGSWFGRWGVNHVYGTGAAVPALVAAGVDAVARVHPARGRAGSSEHQNEDGGWGEDPRSYDDPAWIGRGAEHRLADRLGAARAARRRASARRRSQRGVRLARVATQRADGGWDEPQYTGTGLPVATTTSTTTSTGSTFPIMALGRCLAGRRRDA